LVLLLRLLEGATAAELYPTAEQPPLSPAVPQAIDAPATAADAPGRAVGAASGPAPTPSSVARGQQIFRVNCAFCHGSDGRGGEVGPNLLRSPIVLNDQQGELIRAVVLNGRPDKGMPKFDLSAESITDIAAYLHSNGGSQEHGSIDPKAILVGNADAGKAYFYGKGRCNQCHSVKGDLAGIGAKYDPKSLQDNIISGGAVGLFGTPSATTPPRTVTVTLSAGEVIRGTLIAIDDFDVSLTDDAGSRRSFRRMGDSPHVDVVDPRQAHIDMLRRWDDRDIHNLTAFLALRK
jgi:mono/diheme cytochrome c family protein